MKCRMPSIAIVPILFALLLSLSARTLNARDADLTFLTVAAAQTSHRQCMNTCRARYRDCVHLKQIPSSECVGAFIGIALASLVTRDPAR
jgi:hypothetical protein